MRHLIAFLVPFILFSCSTGSSSGETESADAPGSVEAPIENGVWFVSPETGAELTSPITVKMGVSGMEIEPAGMVNEGKGHHHLIIDGSHIPEGTVVPADSTHIHYGKGQTEVSLDLSPGKHTLTMQFADGVHTSYGRDWSATIEVIIAEE